MAGKIELSGILVNKGNTIGVEGLNVQAERFEKKAKKQIEENLSGIGNAVRTYFEQHYERPIASIQVGESGLVIELGAQAAVAEPEDKIEPTLEGEPEELVEGPPKPERTPAEEKSRLKSLVGALSEKMSAAKERIERSKAYLANRLNELDAQAKGKGETISEFLFTNLGEKYNKLPTWEKIALGGALAVGYGLTLPVSTTAAVLYGGALASTRIAAMAGSFRSNREMLERVNRRAGMGRLENMRLYQWLGSGTETGRKNTAMAKAMLQSFGMTGAMAYTAHELAEHHVGERIGQWFTDYLGGPAAEQAIPPVVLETGAAAPAAPVVPEAPVAEAPAPAPAQSAFQAEVRAVDNQIAAAQMADARAQAAGVGLPESPPSTVPDISVEATPGKGYEFMAKRLWEQLQTQNLDANKFAEGSDMRRLVEATPQDIDKVVHDIAKEHGLFKTEGNLAGSSVQINLGDKLTFNADGSLEVSNGQTYVNAPEGARVTLPLQAEAPVIGLTPEMQPMTDYGAEPALQRQEIVSPPDKIAGPDLTSEQIEQERMRLQEDADAAETAAQQPPASLEGAGPNAFVNSHDVIVNPDATHGYESAKGVYMFGGGALDEQAQKYVLKNHVSVFVDKSYKVLGLINVSRVVEFVPTEDGSVAMVIHNNQSLVPDPMKDFTKRVF